MRTLTALVLGAALSSSALGGPRLDFGPAVVGERQSSGWYQARPAGSASLSFGQTWRAGLGLAAAVPRRTERTGFAHLRTWTRASLDLTWRSPGVGPHFVVAAGPVLTVAATRWSRPEVATLRQASPGARIAAALELPLGNGWGLSLGTGLSSRWRSLDFEAAAGVVRTW